MSQKTKPVKRVPKEHPTKHHAALAFVRELAKDWVRARGAAATSPGRAQQAYDLLVKHGETVSEYVEPALDREYLAQAHELCTKHLHCPVLFGGRDHSPIEQAVAKALVSAFHCGNAGSRR
jgi:hypothetical protein